MWAILIKMTDAHASGEIQEPSRTKPQRAWRPDLMLSLESIVALSGVEALRRAVEPRRRSNNPRSKLERNLIRWATVQNPVKTQVSVFNAPVNLGRW